MRFKSGMLGACIVTLVIMGAVLVGFIGNAEERQVTTTQYDYITDATGTFSYTSEQEYLEYNPNKNYTGWYDNLDEVNSAYTSGIAYTASATANPYRIAIQGGTTTADVTLTAEGTIPNEIVYGNTFGLAYMLVAGTQLTGAGGNLLQSMSWSHIPKTDLPEDADGIYTIDTAGKNVWFSVWDHDDVWSFSSSSVTDYGWKLDSTFYNACRLGWYGMDYYFDEADKGEGTGYTQALPVVLSTSLTLNINTDAVTVTTSGYGGSTNSFTVSWDDFSILWGGTVQSGDDLARSGSYTISGTADPDPVFMDISKGVMPTVTQPIGTYAYWSNGYSNGHVRVLLGSPSSADELKAIFLVNEYPAGTGGHVEVMHNSAGWTFNGTAMGNWPGVLVDLCNDGSVTVTPVAVLTTYTDYAMSAPPVTAENLYTVDYITHFGITLQNGWGANIQVVSTAVWMENYDLIMQNPSVNLDEFWPSESDLRLQLQSVAVVGSGPLNISGIEIPVNTESATVTVDWTDSYGREKTSDLTLSNLTITWEDGHVHIADANRSYDLGEYTGNRTVSFTGDWYFSTGLYAGHQVTQTKYELDPSLDLSNAGMAAIILVALGMLAVAFWYVKMTRGLSGLDVVVIISAVILLFLILGAVLV